MYSTCKVPLTRHKEKSLGLVSGVPAAYFLFAGTVPAAYFLFAGTVPAVYSLFSGTVPAYNLFHVKKSLQSIFERFYLDVNWAKIISITIS